LLAENEVNIFMRMAHVSIAVFATLFSSTVISATPWESYVAVPSPQHAKLVKEPTYSTAEPPMTNGPSRLEQDLRVLGEQIRAGDAEAFYLGLHLRKVSAVDGALAEFLDFTVADFLRVRPATFLTGLSKYGTPNCEEAVYTDPDIYADRFATQAYEMRRRLEAIAASKDKRVVKMRDLCAQRLRSEISTAESHVDSL
jgi:hypothetical protein